MMVHIHFSWMNLDRTFIGKFSYRISVVEYYVLFYYRSDLFAPGCRTFTPPHHSLIGFVRGQPQYTGEK